MSKKAIISKAEKEKLYRQTKSDLGYPIRNIQITDEMMDDFFEMALEDYSSHVNDWLIQQQWVTLQGLNVNNADFLLAFSTQSNEFMAKFTYAYSRQVGLGTNAPAGNRWHLKKDYVTVSADTQVYSIPAGREINEVLWSTPANIEQGMADPFATSNWSSNNLGWSYLGRPAQYVQPTYSLLLSAQDRDLKKRILQSELTYRITGGPNGTKLLYLYPVPGSKYEIAGSFGRHLEGSKVWYFYYDISEEERQKCLEENDDTIKLPSDVPVNVLTWDDLNSAARRSVRDLFIARCKITIGGIRGFFSGTVGPAEAQVQMDYRHLLEEGEKLKEETVTKLLESLQKISLVQLTEDRARIAENVNRERQFQPFMYPIIVK
jgi:hypothetical protein